MTLADDEFYCCGDVNVSVILSKSDKSNGVTSIVLVPRIAITRGSRLLLTFLGCHSKTVEVLNLAFGRKIPEPNITQT